MFKCPHCETEINQATEICPHCKTDLAAMAETALAEEPAPRRSVLRIIMIWLVALGIIAAAAYVFIWYVLPSRTGADSAAQAESRAMAALLEFQDRVEIFAKDEGGRYPQSAEVLGASARMAARNALDAGYTLLYAPGPPEVDGSIKSYTLTARPDRYGFRNFYTDQTRGLHATRENRPATSQDPTL